MGVLDFARGRIMARVGARFQARLDRRVFEAVVRKSALGSHDKSATGLRDLESVQRLLTSPVLMAGFDIPWTPFFLFGIAIFHPWLAYLAVSGGAVLIVVAIMNQVMTKLPQAKSNLAGFKSEALSEQIRSDAEMMERGPRSILGGTIENGRSWGRIFISHKITSFIPTVRDVGVGCIFGPA
jgi:ABC-type protease/lipase transport system fused ATPase/permease subunit